MRAFMGHWHKEGNHTLQAPYYCSCTHTHCTRTHTLRPDWLSHSCPWAKKPQRSPLLWTPESDLCVVAGKYPRWPHMLSLSLGKSPFLFLGVESMGFIWRSNRMCMACKWMRQHLHFIPLHVCICVYAYMCRCWSIYSDFCYLCVCTDVRTYMCVHSCVCVVGSIGIGIRYSHADWDSAGNSQGRPLTRGKKGNAVLVAALVGKNK